MYLLIGDFHSLFGISQCKHSNALKIKYVYTSPRAESISEIPCIKVLKYNRKGRLKRFDLRQTRPMHAPGRQRYASVPLQCSQHERPNKLKHSQYLGGKHHQRHCSVFLSAGTAPKRPGFLLHISVHLQLISNPTMFCPSFTCY